MWLNMEWDPLSGYTMNSHKNVLRPQFNMEDGKRDFSAPPWHADLTELRTLEARSMQHGGISAEQDTRKKSDLTNRYWRFDEDSGHYKKLNGNNIASQLNPAKKEYVVGISINGPYTKVYKYGNEIAYKGPGVDNETVESTAGCWKMAAYKMQYRWSGLTACQKVLVSMAIVAIVGLIIASIIVPMKIACHTGALKDPVTCKNLGYEPPEMTAEEPLKPEACEAQYCFNRGACRIGHDGKKCTCMSGYSGIRCNVTLVGETPGPQSTEEEERFESTEEEESLESTQEIILSTAVESKKTQPKKKATTKQVKGNIVAALLISILFVTVLVALLVIRSRRHIRKKPVAQHAEKRSMHSNQKTSKK